MHIVEKRWVDLNAGHRTALLLESGLKSDWKRALQVVQKRRRLAITSGLGKRRNVTGIVFLGFLFLCMSLWLAGSYLPENRLQLGFYICALTIPGLASGAAFLFFLGKSLSQPADDPPPSLDLIESWWKTLKPGEYVRQKDGDEGEIDFLHSLSFLDDEYIAVWGLLTSAKITSDTDVLLLGPTGIWVFEVKFWNGTIYKKNGVWSKIYTDRYSSNQKTTVYEKAPDQQWVLQKEEISKTIRMRLPSKARFADLIRGGIVFAHPNVIASREHIEPTAASYGTPGAWRNQIKRAAPVQTFTLEDRLQVLDALVTYANLNEKHEVKVLSAVKAARQLHDKVSVALRKYVSERVM